MQERCCICECMQVSWWCLQMSSLHGGTGDKREAQSKEFSYCVVSIGARRTRQTHTHLGLVVARRPGRSGGSSSNQLLVTPESLADLACGTLLGKRASGKCKGAVLGPAFDPGSVFFFFFPPRGAPILNSDIRSFATGVAQGRDRSGSSTRRIGCFWLCSIHPSILFFSFLFFSFSPANHWDGIALLWHCGDH